jgi:hypothetical protein
LVDAARGSKASRNQTHGHFLFKLIGWEVHVFGRLTKAKVLGHSNFQEHFQWSIRPFK